MRLDFRSHVRRQRMPGGGADGGVDAAVHRTHRRPPARRPGPRKGRPDATRSVRLDPIDRRLDSFGTTRLLAFVSQQPAPCARAQFGKYARAVVRRTRAATPIVQLVANIRPERANATNLHASEVLPGLCRCKSKCRKT